MFELRKSVNKRTIFWKQKKVKKLQMEAVNTNLIVKYYRLSIVKKYF